MRQAAPIDGAVRGDQRIYNGGRVSTAHTMFEKDCVVCHGPGPAPAVSTWNGATRGTIEE